jgi:hypothetical protein
VLYTLAVTSCGRHELLHKTLTSFIECISHPPFETIIYEDGPAGKPDWLDSLFPRLGRVRWITGNDRRGQAYAIDALYQEIKTEYIFWSEDDWLFHESGFLQKSQQILANHKNISMVALRSDWNHPLINDPRGFQIAEPYWGGIWGGVCWNPGLRRLSDYRRYGSYGRHVGYGIHGLGHEQTWSKKHLDDGYRIAVLPRHCYHIGGGCSRAIEPIVTRLPKILIAVPACREFKYGRWESRQSPHYNPANEPYCEDIHISGPNPRIQAVRDTWFKDIEPFAHHVEAKFFYGAGSAIDSPDSVVLPVPDDYEHLPHKTQAICRWALQNGFDYVFKCDDDTAVYVQRLVLESLMHPCMDYAGFLHNETCTGGPGYFLSKRAMRAVAQAGTPDIWAEDVWVSTIMGRAGIAALMLPGHTPGFAAHWFWPNEFDAKKLNDAIVTVHAVQPEMMRKWYAERDNVQHV